MVIFNDLSYMTRSDMPDSDWTGEAKYVVEDGSNLANKILSCINGFTAVEDESGNLIDVIPNEVPEPEQPPLSETDLLRAQNKALSDRLEFMEDAMAEMAMKVYAE